MKLLLHMCCGPCACYPVAKLREAGIEPTGYFFNPNIQPYREWRQRLDTAKEYAQRVGLNMLIDENYKLREFLAGALGAEESGQKRCRFCYSWRLEETARLAAEKGFDAFTSTLFYSIYQDHELMRETAADLAKRYGVEFYYEDFRVGWKEGIARSKELGLYRQPYCGCIFSEEERYAKPKAKGQKAA